MALNCGISMLKYILFIFNLLCSICGIALIAIGAIVLAKIGDLQQLNEEHDLAMPAIVFIVLGSIIFLIAFFGCCGAIREDYCMTSTYGFFLIILIVAQIVIAAVVFIYAGDIEVAFKKGFEDIFEKRDQPAVKSLIDNIQSGLECCGKTSAADYIMGLNTFPASCCASKQLPCIPYTTGCTSAIGHFIQDAGSLMGWISLGVAVIELVGLISACCVANSIRNNERRYA